MGRAGSKLPPLRIRKWSIECFRASHLAMPLILPVTLWEQNIITYDSTQGCPATQRWDQHGNLICPTPNLKIFSCHLTVAGFMLISQRWWLGHLLPKIIGYLFPFEFWNRCHPVFLVSLAQPAFMWVAMKSHTALSMSYCHLLYSCFLTWIIPALFLISAFHMAVDSQGGFGSVWLPGTQWGSPSNFVLLSRGKIIQLQIFFHAPPYPKLNTAILLLLAILLKWNL